MELFPAMPLAEWAETKETFHRFAQIVGKVRLVSSNRRNHWWHVPFHPTGRGLTTRPMGGLGEQPLFSIDFDLVRHRLVVDVLDGRSAEFSLIGRSVAAFYERLFETLAGLGIRPDIWAVPYDLDDDTPFDQDTRHAHYDPVLINRYWRILSQVVQLLDRFAAGFAGKISPVNHYWHTFDVAVTRFTGRVGRVSPDTDPVTREAYSREVISSGFWFGDKERPWPAFYSYTAPEPAGLEREPLRPGEAEWLSAHGGHLAILRYDDVRAMGNPVAGVLEFLESAYQAGARLTGLDMEAVAAPGGVTDPYYAKH
ncbi:DUF5996 family protein [Nonomuraea sp. NPDC050786]|uniref:DUF5996 family protein n=1 Tax=Nonomuraea sp. NPDC050786 TaxID=3154840 RepID=UPI0033CAB391